MALKLFKLPTPQLIYRTVQLKQFDLEELLSMLFPFPNPRVTMGVDYPVLGLDAHERAAANRYEPAHQSNGLLASSKPKPLVTLVG